MSDKKTEKNRLSVYIITFNEEKRLPRTLRAIKGIADEVIIVDSGSSDATKSIALSFGAVFYHRDWDNYSDQKAYAEGLCSGDWFLNLDADEVISKELGKEIKKAVRSSRWDVYRLKVAEVYPNMKKPSRWVRCYNIIRLYRKGAAFMGKTYTCDRVTLRDDKVRIGQLNGLVYHYSIRNIFQAVDKYNRYTTEQIDAAIETGEKYSPLRMFFAINLNFIRYFFLHRRFLYGYWGYIDAVNLSYARFLKFAKAYERK